MAPDQLTFVVTVSGDSPFLDRCLETLKRQSVRCPIILSTSTPSWHQRQAARRHGVRLVANPNSRNMTDDWNFAYELAPTPYVILAHQDDIYLEEYAARSLEMARRFPDFLVIFSDYWELAAGRLRTTSTVLLAKRLWLRLFMWRSRLRSIFWKKLLVAFGDPLCAPTAVLNKNAIGPRPFRGSFTYGLDWALWLNLTRERGSFVYCRRPLLVHRLHGSSVTAKAARLGVRYKEELAILERSFPGLPARGLAALYGAVVLLEQRFRRS